MERILTTEQMRSADRFTIDKLGVLEQTLVERAGQAVANEILKRFKGGRVLVCVGKGNNGADGRVVADLLSKKHGFSVMVLSVSNGIFKMFEKKFDIIVDCIFGTGLNKDVEGKYKQAIELINSSGAYIVSCDIPSGINGDNGKVMGVAVKANLTVAIQELKLGHFLGEGIDYCGEVVAKDIGISVWGEDFVKRLNAKTLSKYFIDRNRNVHKGCFGKSVIIGGSKDFSGSVVLSMNALTALKTGAGYSSIVVPDCLFTGLIGLNPECILNSAPDIDGKFAFNRDFFAKYLNADCVCIGMGCGVSENLYQIIKFFLTNYKGTLVVDADGLNCLSQFGIEVLKNKTCRVVVTPHVGEFSRLSGYSKQKILEDSINTAKAFAKEYQVNLVLKNAVTVITDGEEVFLNTTGCNGLAKAGSGDVLCGVISGVLSNTQDILEGCASACYVFGKAGEKAQEKQKSYTVTASDVINALSKVVYEF